LGYDNQATARGSAVDTSRDRREPDSTNKADR